MRMQRNNVWVGIAGRLVTVAAVAVLATIFAGAIVPGFDAGEPLRFALWLAIANGVLTAVVVRLAYPFMVYSAGLLSLALNAGAVMIAAKVVPGVSVDSFGSAVLVAIVITAFTLGASAVLAIDDDGPWQRNVVRRAARRRGLHLDVVAAREKGTDPAPGVIFLEIDGCSEGVLRRAVRNGWMPSLARMLEEGSHVVTPWETGLSSQTGASQAGLLLGHDDGIVAFRWYDRARRAVVVSSAPRDAQALEDRLSDGHGLLAGGGASRNNLFGGDATDAAMTLSRVLRPGGASDAYGVFFARSYNVTRTLVLGLRDVWRELRDNHQARARDVVPRLDHKGWKYPAVRVGTTVIMRDIAIQLLAGDVMRGVPSAYATFVGYDEVAHHDGVERHGALQQLSDLDSSFARLMRLAADAPRRYHFVVLSDHGQSQGRTFRQRFGMTLEDLVRQHLDASVTTRSLLDAIEPEAQLGGAAAESIARGGAVGQAARLAAGREAEAPERESGTTVGADLLVMASGNLGLVYLTDRATRATRADLDEQHPGLVDGVARHPGVSFVLVATGSGPVVVGGAGERNLATGAVSGRDPLEGFGPWTAAKLLRHDAFDNVPDLLVISMHDPATGTVAAFEELIGSHGGLGGEQEHPFIVRPAEWSDPDGDLLGALRVHDQLVHWMVECGARSPDT